MSHARTMENGNSAMAYFYYGTVHEIRHPVSATNQLDGSELPSATQIFNEGVQKHGLKLCRKIIRQHVLKSVKKSKTA